MPITGFNLIGIFIRMLKNMPMRLN